MFMPGDNGELIVCFGLGTVRVCTASREGEHETEVVLTQSHDGVHPVGAYHANEIGQTTKDLATRGDVVRLQFLNVAGLDVLMEQLGKVRAAMLAHPMPPPGADHGTWWSSTTITPESAAAPSLLADFGGGDSGGAGAGSSWGDSGASSCDSGGGGDSSGGGDSGGGGD
jgi:hypothetical protein